MSVLVVDDSRVMRRVQRRIVDNVCSVPIYEAEDGLAALQRLREIDFEVDLILTDWTMPRMDGLELIRVLKGHPELSKIPVLMVTSHAEAHRMRQALRAGVDGYLLKPFTEAMFLRALCALSPSGEFSPIDTPQAGNELAPESLLDLLLAVSRGDLFQRSDLLELPTGSTLLEASRRVDHFYLVLEGEVGRFTTDSSRSDETFGAGDCFGVTELMAREITANDFVAQSNVKVLRATASYFEELLHASPELCLRVTRLVAERARATELGAAEENVLAGSLDVLELADLIQALNLRQSSGRIELPDCEASITLRCGEIHAVEFGAAKGEEAFRSLVENELTTFRFVPGACHGERNVLVPTTRLLLDTMRAIDEAGAKA